MRSNFTNMRILAVGAHPDDIELGCGGSLAKLAAQGAQIRAVVFSKGRRGALADGDREAETRRALSTLGIGDIHIHDFPDTELWKHVNDLVSVVEDHVRAIEPHRAYTMFQEDRHQDHRAVFEATVIATRNVRQVLSYETPSSYPNFRPTLFEEIDEFLEIKVASIKCHSSQGNRIYMNESKVRSAADFRGVQVGVGSTEGFMPYKLILDGTV